MRSIVRVLSLMCVTAIAGKAQQDFGNCDIGLGPIDRIRKPIELISFSLQAFETFIEWGLKGGDADGTGTDTDYNQHEQESLDCSHKMPTASPL